MSAGRRFFFLVIITSLVLIITSLRLDSQNTATAALEIEGKLGGKYPRVMYRVISSISKVGEHNYYDIEKTVVSDPDGRILVTLDRHASDPETNRSLGQYYDKEGNLLLTSEDCKLRGKQNFFYLEDVNFDGYTDIVTRTGCGTGGCSYSFFLFIPYKMTYSFSRGFSKEAAMIRRIGLNEKQKTIEFFSRYQESATLRRFKVQKNNYLKLIYTLGAYLDSKTLEYQFGEWQLLPDGRSSKRTWKEKYAEGKNQSELMKAP